MANGTRNPSPPPLTAEERESLSGDFIGDTIFSKRWVLDLMLKLYKHDSDFIYHIKTTQPESDQDDENLAQDITLNENFENSVCELWDMSANHDVALFLYENDCKVIFLDAMEKTQAPRLMEICLGLLGNLVCIKEICTSYSEDKIFRKSLLGYLSVTDASSLVELTRMVCTCINRESVKGLWVETIKELSSCEILIYLLTNSLNVELISRVVEVLDVIFDEDSEIIDSCLSDDFLNTLFEAYDSLASSQQNGSTSDEALTSLLHILQTATTLNKGIELLNSNHENVSRFLIKKCLNSNHQNGISEDDSCDTSIVLSDQYRLPYYAYVLSTLSLLIAEKSKSVLTLINDNVKVMENLIMFLHTKCEEGKDTSSSFAVYMVVCFEALYAVCEKLYKSSANNQDYDIQHFSRIKDCIETHVPVIINMVKIWGADETLSTSDENQNLVKIAELLGFTF